MFRVLVQLLEHKSDAGNALGEGRVERLDHAVGKKDLASRDACIAVAERADLGKVSGALAVALQDKEFRVLPGARTRPSGASPSARLGERGERDCRCRPT